MTKLTDKIKKASQSVEDTLKREQQHFSGNVVKVKDTIGDTVSNALDHVAGALGLDNTPLPQDPPIVPQSVPGVDPFSPYRGTNADESQIQNDQSGSSQVPAQVQAAMQSIRTGNKFFDHVIDSVSGVTQPVQDFGDSLHDKIDSLGDEISSHVHSAISNVTGIPSDISNWIGDEMGDAKNKADAVKDKLENAAQQAYQGARDKWTDLKNDFKPLSDLPGDLWDDLKMALVVGGIGLLLLWQGTSSQRHEASEWIQRTGKRTFDEFVQEGGKVVGALPSAALGLALL